MQQRRLLQWLIPRPFYLVSSAFYGGVLLAFLLDNALGQYQNCGCQASWLRPTLMVCAIASLFALDRIEFRRYGEETPVRAAFLFFVMRILIYEAITLLDGYRYSVVLTLFLPMLGLWYFGSLIGSELALLACVDYALHEAANTPDWVRNSDNLQLDLLFLLVLVFSLALTQVLVREKANRRRSEILFADLGEAHQELEDAHHQLRLYANQVEELATTKERMRLARDIHDSLGHYLTIINVQLEKALAYHERDASESEQAMRDAKRLAGEALQDVRHSVSTLRAMDGTFRLVPALQTVVERLRSPHLKVEMRIDGREEGYSKQALMSLFRVAQEGFTNIQKYAQATSVRMDLHLGEAQASLHISDDGQGFDPARLAVLPSRREGSYGLQGVRERLELIGGMLQVDSQIGQGTSLLATIPREQPEGDERFRTQEAGGKPL